MTLALAQSQIEVIMAACKRHHVAPLHAFGSVLRADYRPGESDIDQLNDLPIVLASRVELVISEAVRNPSIKQTIEASKQEIYAA